MSIRAKHRFNWSDIRKIIQSFASILTVVAIAIFGFWGGHLLLPGGEHAEAEIVPVEESVSSESSEVSLTAEKLMAADIQTMTVEAQPFQLHQSVPGTIVYDATRKVELRAMVDCVIKQALVQPAQVVKQGQPLLILSGPKVGAARNEVSQCQSNYELVRREYEWTLDTHTNMQNLLELLKRSPTVEQIKSRFDSKNLGEHRDAILTSYSEFCLAKKLAERTDRLENQGVIPGKTADERRSQFEIAAARYDAVAEEMKFQTLQGLKKAKAELAAAAQHLDICQENLAALLGPYAAANGESPAANVSEFILNAPRSGQIVELPAVDSARFEPGEVMAEIADVRGVWVEAQISQRDWHALSLSENQLLAIRVPALPNQEFQAHVRHLGTSVSKTTMAIPLIAGLDNAKGLFRPGMSVWVEVPTSEPRSAIVVPVGAVQRNEMDAFVFVQNDEKTFARRDIVVGGESGDRIEIKSGLTAGDQIVVHGAFFLKSELLLAEEE